MNIFSVIVPIYNTPEEYLRKCIQSTLDQDFDAYEVLLVDDGSRDYCGKICEESVAKSEKVRYIRQENQGVSVARNTGIDEAKGEYIVFLDADDWLPDGFLGRLAEQIPDERPDVVMYGYCSDYSNKCLERTLTAKSQEQLLPERLIDAVLGLHGAFAPYDVGTIWAKAIKRRVLCDHSIRFPIGIKKGQDTVFILYVYRHCKALVFVPEIGYHYRKNNRSVTHKLNPQIVAYDEMLLEQYDVFLRRAGRETEAEDILSAKRLQLLLGEYLMLYFHHPDNTKPRRELIAEYEELTEKEPYRTAIQKAKTSGRYLGMKRRALQKKRFGLIWFLRTLEAFAQRILVSEFD